MSKLESEGLAPASETFSGAGVALPVQRHHHYSLLTAHDKVLLALMVGIPLFVFVILIWITTLASIVLSFTDWQLIGNWHWVGLDNYTQMFTTYPFFWTAVRNNLLWLLFFLGFATPMGILLAVCLDRQLRGGWLYQTIFFTPVVLSLAVVGIIWNLQLSPLAGNGFIDSMLTGTGLVAPANAPNWLGESTPLFGLPFPFPPLGMISVLIVASWRHIGYIMVLYLAGLKSVDPALREAAAIDGANERQTFFHVVFPVMAPINRVIVVVTVIEALRAFDIVWILSHGKEPLQLLSTLIVSNALSESSLIGFGSAIAVFLLLVSLIPIIAYLTRVMRSED